MPLLFNISWTVGVALTNDSLDWQLLLSVLVPSSSPDLRMSTVVELWPSEKSKSIQTTGGYLVNPQGRKAREESFRLYMISQGFSPSVNNIYNIYKLTYHVLTCIVSYLQLCWKYSSFLPSSGHLWILSSASC